MSTERSGAMSVRPPGLVDVLDRILDKGLVIAGDIKVSLANVELLTLQIRLLICSIDKAEKIGLNWWRYDKNLSDGGAAGADNELRTQVAELESRLDQLTATAPKAVEKKSRAGRKEPAAGAKASATRHRKQDRKTPKK